MILTQGLGVSFAFALPLRAMLMLEDPQPFRLLCHELHEKSFLFHPFTSQDHWSRTLRRYNSIELVKICAAVGLSFGDAVATIRRITTKADVDLHHSLERLGQRLQA